MFVCGILHVCFCVKNGIVLRKYDVVSHQGFTWLYFPFLDVVVCRPFLKKVHGYGLRKRRVCRALSFPPLTRLAEQGASLYNSVLSPSSGFWHANITIT